MNGKTLENYVNLTRLNRPIGIYLLLWPTLSALWLAAEGFPDIKTLIIFSLGVLIMRSAGCVINDYADRKIDGHVSRTKDRPIATGLISEKHALLLFFSLVFLALVLVLMTNALTVKMSLVAVLLASAYPFMKRHTYLPQVVLGAAFAWAVPMAYTALGSPLDETTWLLFSATVLWTVAYDTQYAMVDREDDIKIGVRSTAILFGKNDRLMIGVLQALAWLTWLFIGFQADLGTLWLTGLFGAAILFSYQQRLIRQRNPAECFNAFLNNHWVGLILFLSLVLEFAYKF